MAKSLLLRQLAGTVGGLWPLPSHSPRLGYPGKLLYQFLDHGNTWKGGHLAFQQHDPASRVKVRKAEVLELP